MRRISIRKRLPGPTRSVVRPNIRSFRLRVVVVDRPLLVVLAGELRREGRRVNSRWFIVSFLEVK